MPPEGDKNPFKAIASAFRAAGSEVARFARHAPAWTFTFFQRAAEIANPLRVLFRLAGEDNTHQKTRDNLIGPYFKTWQSKLGAAAVNASNAIIVYASGYIFNPIVGDMWRHAGNWNLLNNDLARLALATAQVLFLYGVRDVVLGINQACLTNFAKDKYTDIMGDLSKKHDLKTLQAEQGLNDIDTLVCTGSGMGLAANTSVVNLGVFSVVIWGLRPQALFITAGFCLLNDLVVWKLSKGTIPLLSKRAIIANATRVKFRDLTPDNLSEQKKELKKGYREMLYLDVQVALINAGLGILNFGFDMAGKCIPFLGSMEVGNLAKLNDAVGNVRAAMGMPAASLNTYNIVKATLTRLESFQNGEIPEMQSQKTVQGKALKTKFISIRSFLASVLSPPRTIPLVEGLSDEFAISGDAALRKNTAWIVPADSKFIFFPEVKKDSGNRNGDGHKEGHEDISDGIAIEADTSGNTWRRS